MSYQKHGSSKPYLVIRKQGHYPVRVVAGAHFRTKKRAQREAEERNRLYKPRTDIKFEVRKEGWNRKCWYS